MDNNDKLQNEYENIEDASPIFFDDIHEEDEAPAHSAEKDLSEAPASPSVETANDAFVPLAEEKVSNAEP